jgi:hypothetical protein
MTPEQQKELDRTASLYQTALISLGAQAVQHTLDLWADVPPLPDRADSTATAKWLAAAVAYVMHRRLRARDMALAYYRYQRAIATGKTIALPGQDNPEYVSIPELKRQFEASLNPASAESPFKGLPGDEDADGSPDGSEAVSEAENDPEVPDWAKNPVPVEHVDGLEEALDQIEDAAEQQVRDNLQNLGPKNLNKKLKLVKAEDADTTDKARQQAHKDAGNRQAAAAARNTMNGARGPLFEVGSSDGAALGFVRVSKTGTPCGFCAMLISRGFIAKSPVGSSLFKSNEGTGERADGTIVTYGDLDLYHDNCQCYAVPIFSMAQLKSVQFAINREYAALWPAVTQGLGGKAALRVWRRHFRNQAKSHKSQVAAA